MLDGISIVVTTWNRTALLERALRSIQKAKKEYLIEVIVVDDFSDLPPDVSKFQDLNIRTIRHSENKGGGIARNTGIQAAKFDWVAVLDDDDEFLPMAFDVFFRYLKEEAYQKEAVLFFSYIQYAKKRSTFRFFLKEYVNKPAEDFFCLIHKSIWMKEKYSYPNSQIGGTSLLWMKLALLHGIVFIDEAVAMINYDADLRMCSTNYQMRYPGDYMNFHRAEIEFISPYQREFRNFYRKKILGYAIFSVFSYRKEEARKFLKTLKYCKVTMCLAYVSTFFPVCLLRIFFRRYRKLVSG